ncbi:MAG TPA: barstar family protein [Bryobacteraceae bacterium]|nr:barstar family protein [Bryobacteraceae bacterium]HPT24863.1 barstar family protein [Bryobacteraceae bacterium]
MIPTLEQIMGRVDDPETPVVWLDPVMPSEFWQALPDGLRSRGYRVFHIDQHGVVEDRKDLLARFDQLVHTQQPQGHDFESLKRCLLALAGDCERGWAVLFSNPDPLRQDDEEAFEELMEVLELVHESIYEIHMKSFKFVVRD